MALWLDIIRIMLGVLMLLALSSLYGLFRKTKVVSELQVLSLGFALYTIRGVLQLYTHFTQEVPSLAGYISIEELLSALIYLTFAIAIVRFMKIFNAIRVEDRLVKTLHELLG